MSTNRDKTTARMQATPSRRVTRGAAARGEQATADHDATPAVEGPGGSPDAMDRSPDGAGSMGSSHSDPSFVAPQGTTPITPSARQTRSGSAPQQGEPIRGVPDATPGQDQEPKTPSAPDGGVSDPVSNNEGANAPSRSGSAPRESVSGAGEAANSLAGLPALQDFVSQPTPVASSPPLLEYDHLSPAWQGVTGPLDEIPASFFESTEGNSPRMDVQLVGEVSRGAASSGSEAEWRGQARARYTRINRGRVPIPASLQCDRSFLLHPRDAYYVDAMQTYLFAEGQTPSPFISGPLTVYIGEDVQWAEETEHEWQMVCTTGRYISHEDFLVARRHDQGPITPISIDQDNHMDQLLVPYDRFPLVPEFYMNRNDYPGVSMPVVRALYYFANLVARSESPVVRRRWADALSPEIFAHGLVAHDLAWSRPLLDTARIWVPPELFLTWGAQVEGNRSIFVRSISGRVEFPRVSIPRTLGILRTAKSEGRLVGFRDKFTRRMATFVYCPTTRIQSLGGRLPIADRVSRGRGQSRGVKRIPGRSIRRYDSELPVGQDAPPASRGVKRQYEPSQEPYGPSRVGEYADDVDDARPNVAFEPVAGPPGDDLAIMPELSARWLRRTAGVPDRFIALMRGQGPYTVVEALTALSSECVRLESQVQHLDGLVTQWETWNRDRTRAPGRVAQSSRRYYDPYDDRDTAAAGASYLTGVPGASAPRAYDPYAPRNSNYTDLDAPGYGNYRNDSGAGPSDPYAPPRSRR